MNNQQQQTSLFTSEQDSANLTGKKTTQLAAPLAAKIRPKMLADYVGQQHILGDTRHLN